MDIASWTDVAFGHGEDTILWWQMMTRAVVVFFCAAALIGLSRRAFGKNTPIDFVIAIMLGSVLSRAVTGNAPLFPSLGAAAVLVLVHVALAYLAARFQPVSRVVKRRAVPLMEDGKIDWKRMHRHQIGEHDLLEAMRLNGIDRLDRVRAAHLERSGDISIIPQESR